MNILNKQTAKASILTFCFVWLSIMFYTQRVCAESYVEGDPVGILDISKSISVLYSTAAAWKDYKSKQTIFKSEAKECSKNIVSSTAKDCCAIDDAGSKGLMIAGCEKGEQELLKARGEGRAVELGEYCHNRVLGVCTSYHKVYCTFESKLARIVRVAARDQLGLDLGSPEQPECKGLSPEQFYQINFSKIDFSEFYNEINFNDELDNIVKLINERAQNKQLNPGEQLKEKE
jgi:conjugal transfer mating pair stabilization protein TraN